MPSDFNAYQKNNMEVALKNREGTSDNTLKDRYNVTGKNINIIEG
jgi:hypothetical protein